MGQEAGKPAWPKAGAGYQTITGRRYGRRHAYVSFRPTLATPRSPSAGDWQEMEMNHVNGEHSRSSKGNISSVLQAIFPLSSNVVHPEEKTAKLSKNNSNKKLSTSRNSMETSDLQRNKLKCDQAAPRDLDLCTGSKKRSEASAWALAEEDGGDRSSPSVQSFVNIDSYESESSGDEDDAVGSDPSLGLQKRLDSLICELGKEFDCLSGLHSYLYTRSSEGKDSLIGDASVKCFKEPTQEEPACPSAISRSGEPKHSSSSTEGFDVASVGSVSGHGGAERVPDRAGSPSQMVVRPKIRKQASETQLEKRRCSQREEAHSRPSAKGKSGSAPPFSPARGDWTSEELLSDCPRADCDELEQLERWNTEELKNMTSDDKDFWEELGYFDEKGASFRKDDESSECSEGEWSATWTSDSGVEKKQNSPEESWETLPCLEDLQSNSSSLEDVPELNFSPEEHALLEEGEIPWMMYNEETGSSTDEDPIGGSHFVQPGLFILDGNNNVEDDSSLSEDFDAEWRLLDDFGEGFGMAQAISYVDPQLLTYMALEEHLAQAMEAALAHLESLAVDVEQAQPPATEQIIECLPQITVLEDHNGQEQCCAICCCEYLTNEIATQLPCHHMFHKLCVTLWLQKSGTCPVCRHVLSPAFPEGPVSTSFVSEQDIPPSDHSAAGTR